MDVILSFIGAGRVDGINMLQGLESLDLTHMHRASVPTVDYFESASRVGWWYVW